MKRSSLAVERPDLLSSWSSKNKESPYEVSAGSHKKVLWECELGHEWSATVKNRALLDSGCPYCNCRAVLKGFNDLATLRPELIEEWSDRNNPLKPTDIPLFSNRKVWWRCKIGHEWFALVSSRSDGHGCPYCAGQRVWEGFNDLQTTHPKLVSEWSDKNTKISPTNITAKNTSNVWWHCSKCGNDYKAVVSARVNGLVCPYCTKEKLSKIRAERLLDEYIHESYIRDLPKIATMYYARLKGMEVILDDESLTGLPLTAYVPDIGLVIDVCHRDKEKCVKKSILKKKEIAYVSLPKGLTEEQTIEKSRAAFSHLRVFFDTSTAEDIKIIREKYAIWARNRTFSS